MAYGRVALGADLTGDVQYYVEQSNAIAGGAYLGDPNYTSVDGLIYTGYPKGVVPPQAQALLDQGYQTGYGDFNNALVAWNRANSRRATMADITTASSFVPAPPPAPVVGPTQYLVNGVLYTNLADAKAAEAAGPPPPPPADTGTIHYDPGTDSYLPGPSPVTPTLPFTYNPGDPMVVPPELLHVDGTDGTDSTSDAASAGMTSTTKALLGGGALVAALLFLRRR